MEFHQADRWQHISLKKRDGTPVECRRNGQTKRWKTRPYDFKIPIKYGLNSYGYITPDNCNNWKPV